MAPRQETIMASIRTAMAQGRCRDTGSISSYGKMVRSKTEHLKLNSSIQVYRHLRSPSDSLAGWRFYVDASKVRCEFSGNSIGNKPDGMAHRPDIARVCRQRYSQGHPV